MSDERLHSEVNDRILTQRLLTRRLELVPLASAAAAALPDARADAAEIIGASLSPGWPRRDLLDVLPIQAAADPAAAQFGVWLIIEQDTNTVIGDIGFFGPPGPDGAVEIGYSIVRDRRRRGYATEAARELVAWVHKQANVNAVLAACNETNLPSIRTLERLGFSRTGQDDGQVRWRLRSSAGSLHP